MAEEWGPTKPHPLSQLKTELVWEGKYDEYGNRREVEIAGAETIPVPSNALATSRRLLQAPYKPPMATPRFSANARTL